MPGGCGEGIRERERERVRESFKVVVGGELEKAVGCWRAVETVTERSSLVGGGTEKRGGTSWELGAAAIGQIFVIEKPWVGWSLAHSAPAEEASCSSSAPTTTITTNPMDTFPYPSPLSPNRRPSNKRLDRMRQSWPI